MLLKSMFRNRSGVLLAALAGILCGCHEEMVITQMPEFYTPDLKSIVVASFRNQTNWQGAGEIVSDRLSAGLARSGAYTVTNRNDLQALLDQQDLASALTENPSTAVQQIQGMTQAQALLVGTVTTYSATSDRQPKQVPMYAFNSKGMMYVSGYRQVIHTRNEGYVSVTATLLRVSDGSAIYTTPQSVWAQVKSEGESPSRDAHSCAAAAADNVVAQLVETFAPVRKKIKIDPGKALRTAQCLYDDEWDYCDKFPADDEEMFVVVSLPSSCDRNRFRITIVRKDERQDLVEKDIRWDSKYGGFGWAFSPKEIAAKGGGPGKYQVKFYSGPKPIMTRDFDIR